jgi:hypothetical protein
MRKLKTFVEAGTIGGNNQACTWQFNEFQIHVIEYRTYEMKTTL